jgi:hypothetical protein
VDTTAIYTHTQLSTLSRAVEKYGLSEESAWLA